MIVSDGHKGIQKAVRESFIGSSWQMCHVHLTRQVLKKVPKKKQKEVAGNIKEAMVDRLNKLNCKMSHDAEYGANIQYLFPNSSELR